MALGDEQYSEINTLARGICDNIDMHSNSLCCLQTDVDRTQTKETRTILLVGAIFRCHHWRDGASSPILQRA